METHSSVFAWRIPGTGQPGGLPSMGSHRVGHDCSDLAAVQILWKYPSSSFFLLILTLDKYRVITLKSSPLKYFYSCIVWQSIYIFNRKSEGLVTRHLKTKIEENNMTQIFTPGVCLSNTSVDQENTGMALQRSFYRVDCIHERD